MKKQTFIILTVLVIGLTGLLSYYQVKPGRVSDKQLQSAAFVNTMQILAEITQHAHPSGSAANYQVRDYLVKEIRALGIEPEVIPFSVSIKQRIAEIENKMAKDPAYRSYMTRFMKAKGYDNPRDFVRGKFGFAKTDTVTLHNILVKLAAPEANKSVMLVSHYDSVATGPGAGDDGIAVASMLNYLQQAVKENTRKNNVYLLFTDGEEQGLLGAKNYVEHSDEKTKSTVEAVFNFEARGNRGGLIMFESAKDNYTFVKHLNKAVPRPIAFSIATAIYEQMPNDTDFSVFKHAKYQGLNFAMVEGDENYHASTDTAENLAKDTAYQYMQTVSGIGHYFGKLDLSVLQQQEKGIFFPFLAARLIVLPEFVGYILGFLPFLLALLIGSKEKKVICEGNLSCTWIFLRIIIGVVIMSLTAKVFPASYMVSIPFTQFFLLDLMMLSVGNMNRENALLGLSSWFLFAAGTLIVLSVPLMYMIQIALHTWYITAACIALPLMLIAIYFRKIYLLYPQNKRVKKFT